LLYWKEFLERLIFPEIISYLKDEITVMIFVVKGREMSVVRYFCKNVVWMLIEVMKKQS
jgi:hypothetical protein